MIEDGPLWRSFGFMRPAGRNYFEVKVVYLLGKGVEGNCGSEGSRKQKAGVTIFIWFHIIRLKGHHEPYGDESILGQSSS